MEKTEKLTFKEWFENLWYRYKWLLICVAVLAVFLAVSLVQVLSAKKPDVTIMYVGPAYITPEDRDRLMTSMESLAPDYNNDGAVATDILDITLHRVYDANDSSNYTLYDQNNEAYTRFQTELRVGDAVLYILDSTFYDECVELNILTPLEEIFGKDAVPSGAVGEYGISIGSLDAQYLPGFDKIPDDMVICLRRSPDKDAIKYNRKEELWESNKEAFERIVQYKR